MGRLFLVDLEGRTYNCKSCKTQLALVDDLISKALDCRRRKAYLFNNVVNITVGPLEERPMISGTHTVADIVCCCCGLIVGWKYESAYESSQKYKEGKFVLERRRIIDSMDSELCIHTRASTNMKPRTRSSAIQPSWRDEIQARIQSFMDRILEQLGRLQSSVASFDSELGSFENRAAGFEVELDGIHAQLLEWMGQHGLIPDPEPCCACTDPISGQDVAQRESAEPSPGPSRMDEIRKKMSSFEEEVLENSRSLETTIAFIYGWLASLDSPVADLANDEDATTHTDDDTASPSSRPSWGDEFWNQISSFEEHALAHFGNLQASIGSINSRLESLDSRVTGLEVKVAELKVKLDGIRSRLPLGPPSNPSQAP